METELRSVVESDLPSIAITLAEAFADDPYGAYLQAKVPGYPRAAGFYEGRVAEAWKSPTRELVVTADFESVAIWKPTRGELGEPDRQFLPPDVFEVLRRINASEPATPHYFLDWLGTMPSKRGQGYGAKAIKPFLLRCDSDGVGGAFWTSNPASLSFYGHHGFAVTEKIEFPDAPSAWWLWRDPLVLAVPLT